MSILSNRIGKARPPERMLPYLVSVALVAVTTIVPFSVASIALLGTANETPTGARVENRPIEEKVVDIVTDSKAPPIPLQTKLPSSSEANHAPSSTPLSSLSGMRRQEAVTELPPLGEASVAAVDTPHGSTPGPSTDETALYPLTGSQKETSASHAKFDQGGVTSTPEIHFPEETQEKESTGFYGSATSPGSDGASLNATRRGVRVVKADRDKIANKLNRAELRSLLGGGRALGGVPRR
jgi:hypothetical protein